MKTLWASLLGKRGPLKVADIAKEPSVGKRTELSEVAITEVLAQFRQACPPSRAIPDGWAPFWQDKLGEDFNVVAKQLFLEGHLRNATLEEWLVGIHTVKSLKEIASAAGLKATGKKSNLAAGIAARPSQAVMKSFLASETWICTEEAAQRVATHRASKATARTRALKASYSELRANHLKNACEIVCELKAKSFYPEGLNVDWGKEPARLLPLLSAIQSAHPGYHKRRYDGVTDGVRRFASMELLWGPEGRRFIRQFEEKDLEETEVASRMLVFHAIHLSTLEQARELHHAGTKLVAEVICTVDRNTTCDACLSADGSTYDLSEVPELPLERCDCEIGCRCSVTFRCPLST